MAGFWRIANSAKRAICVTDDVEFQMCHKCVTDVSQQKLESIKLIMSELQSTLSLCDGCDR